VLYRLFISDEAREDLDAIWQVDPAAAAAIKVLLDELRGSQALLNDLTTHGLEVELPAGRFDIKKWHKQQRRGRNLFRIRAWRPNGAAINYRIVYVLELGTRRYYVLGIHRRNVLNYDDENSHAVQRILAAYDRIGLRSVVR
jgi:hypothetical protein